MKMVNACLPQAGGLGNGKWLLVKGNWELVRW